MNDLVTGMLAGAVLIVFGLVPGLLHSLAEDFRDGIEAFKDAVRNGSQWSSRIPGPSRPHEQAAQPTWLAGLGAALMAAVLLAFLLR